ncbi:MAG TPA: tetratricopeptide repeat protein [Candidatus Saccharimonadales bacterium]|nr:tetratricopeptide repeat protein [Candidatus Saccharimonadales bacterium]
MRSRSGFRVLISVARTVVILLWAGAVPAFAGVLLADAGGPDHALYSQGRSLIFEESWKEARGVFQTLAHRYPKSTYLDDALYWTAFALYEEGDPAGSYETLHNLLDRYPDSPWIVDARTLMVRAADAALKRSHEGTRTASAGAASAYKEFIEESTRDSNAQVSLLAIDTLLNDEPQKAPDLLRRVRPSSGNEGAAVLLDRFFGNELVKVTFKDQAAGLAEGNVMILVRAGDRSLQLTLSEALDALTGGGPYNLSKVVLRELRERILEAERSLVSPGPIVEQEHVSPGRRRASTIVRVVDGEVHYYDNGAETLRIVVLRRSAGFSQANVHVFVDGEEGSREVALKDLMSSEKGPSARGISADALLFLTQSLGVIKLDLSPGPGED